MRERGINLGKIKKLIAAAVCIMVLASFAGCDLITKTPEGEKNTVVAKIGSEKITKGDFEKRMSYEIARFEAYYGQGFFDKKENQDYLKEVKANVLDQMVQEKLLLQKAKELKVVTDEKALNDEIEKKVQDSIKLAGDEQKFNQQLQELKLTMDDYRTMVRDNLIFEKLYENITKDVKVTDDDINKYYYSHQYDYTEKPNVMNVSHILVNTEDEAKKIKEQLDKGAKFEDLAKQYSQDTGSKDKGGALGDINYNDTNYDKDFMDNAIILPEGKISGPVKTQFGYHIIKMNKKTEYPLIPLEKVKDEISKLLLEQNKQTKFQDTVKDWESKAKIKKYTERL